MSLKYAAQKVGDNHYVLPKTKGMKVDAHAFLSDRLYELSEELMWHQIMQSASYEGVIGAYLMPDCLTDDTEVLTSRGFVPIKDISLNTKIANVTITSAGAEGVTWKAPKNVINRPLRTNEKVFSHTFDGLNKTIKTTEGHRHPFITFGNKDSAPCFYGKKLCDVISSELPKESLTKNFVWSGNGYLNSHIHSGVDLNGFEIRLIAWIVGDGNIKTTENKNAINKRLRFGFKKKRKIQRVTHLLNEIGLGYTVCVSNKQTEIYINTKSSKKYLDIVGDDKKYPVDWITELSADQARVLLDEMIQVDGDYENHLKMGSRILFSSRESDVNFISSLVSLHIGTTTVRWRDRVVEINDKQYNSGYWKISVIDRFRLKTDSKNGLHNSKVITEPIEYDGNVVCVTCDTGYFIARQNGVTFVTGNCHMGYGIPVGGVVVTEDTIIQSGSGYDISCGVVYLKVPGLHAEDVASHKKRTQWVRAVAKRVALGVGSDRPDLMPDFDRNTIDDILRYGAKAIGVKADVCERQYIKVPEDIDLSVIDKAYSKAKPQLGSVGGGNHFIEMQVDKEDGSVWVMIHCGSRGYGWQTANEFFFRGAALRGMQRNERERAWLRIDEELGKQYWAHHNSAANYAVANRHIIVRGVQEALQKIFKAQGEVYYEISHNLVQQETLVLPDGTTQKGFVHRKGATRAFPAGHPDLVGTKWESTGHPCLIPGSMYHGAAILFPKENAYKTACSVNHGSGRVLGRKAAKRKLEHKQEFIDNQMRNVERKLGGTMIRGIVGNTKKTPLDECSHVYKDLDEVLAVLEAEGIAEVKHRLWPVANLKGVD